MVLTELQMSTTFRQVILLILVCFSMQSVSKLHQEIIAQDSHLCLMASGKNCLEQSSEIVTNTKQEHIFLSCKVDTDYIKVSQIRWTRNNKEINLGPPYTITWEKGKVLMIRPVIIGITDGYYECIASLGTVEIKKSVKIIVKNELPSGFPIIKAHPVDIRQPERKIIDFKCEVSGKQPLQVVWFHNRIPITCNNNHHVCTYSVSDHSDFTSNLSLRNVSNSHTGFYQCAAFNEYGQAVSYQAMFTVAPKRIRKTTLNRKIEPVPCPGFNDGSVAPDLNKTYSTFRICCEGHETLYPNLQWSNPSFGNNKVEGLTIEIFPIHGNRGCFLLDNTTTEFKFTPDIGYQSGYSYQVFIYTRPVSNRTKRIPTKFNDCAANILNDCQVTSAPIFSITKPSGFPAYKDKFYIAIFVALSVIFALAGVWCYIRIKGKFNFYKQSKALVPLCEKKEKLVYISHCATSNKDIEKVLRLAEQLHSISNVQVCIDLCNQNEIIDCGGLSLWIPEHLGIADKIIMVFSPSYLEAITSRIATEEIICKVNMEADLIRKLLYNSCQRSSQLAVVLDGVKKEDTPAEFNGRAQFSFPNRYDDLDQNWIALLGYLLDMNPLEFTPKLK
ncbi:uncharacterized protein LOC100198846 isoform X1 [Hydra vulgaris]|uniref:uncharacterized protein LOC100198846 isoform X1 n=1 Tax=Hydra vulgaris TaxID=6087 RepID=UPI001F5FAF0F|nr:uncharacterized protein LOC100198846 isoform X2 [Hydra vulgaris]